MKVHTRFLKSAAAPKHFPPPQAPEVAFLGRSNVGKSSLLNALLGTKLAHVSSTPGRTQTINFFELRFGKKESPPDLLLVDLPGYGYARAPRELVAGWPKFIEPYLKSRETLALCVCLVDANVPPQESDRRLLHFLQATDRDLLVVATKTDKLSGNKLRVALQELRQALGVELMAFSAKTAAGKEELWRRIASLPS